MGSALLDAANRRHWELIQQTEGGTAWLLRHYEAYASALAQNMRHTYLSPFTIVTPNIGEGPTGTWRGGLGSPWMAHVIYNPPNLPLQSSLWCAWTKGTSRGPSCLTMRLCGVSDPQI